MIINRSISFMFLFSFVGSLVVADPSNVVLTEEQFKALIGNSKSTVAIAPSDNFSEIMRKDFLEKKISDEKRIVDMESKEQKELADKLKELHDKCKLLSMDHSMLSKAHNELTALHDSLTNKYNRLAYLTLIFFILSSLASYRMARHFNAIGDGLQAIPVLGGVGERFHDVAAPLNILAAPFHIADAVVEKVFYKR